MNYFIIPIILLSFLKPEFLIINHYQSITQAEYFINTDPGEGKGTAIDISKGFVVTLNQQNIPYNYGDRIFVRVKNENNVWSAPYGRKLGTNIIDSASVFRVYYPHPNDKRKKEYKMSIISQKVNGLIATALSDTIPLSDLNEGDTLLVQMKGVNYIWSDLYQIIYHKPTGVKEQISENAFMSISPNPATDKVNISYNVPLAINATITITNELGVIQKTFKVPSVLGS